MPSHGSIRLLDVEGEAAIIAGRLRSAKPLGMNGGIFGIDFDETHTLLARVGVASEPVGCSDKARGINMVSAVFQSISGKHTFLNDQKTTQPCSKEAVLAARSDP